MFFTVCLARNGDLINYSQISLPSGERGADDTFLGDKKNTRKRPLFEFLQKNLSCSSCFAAIMRYHRSNLLQLITHYNNEFQIYILDSKVLKYCGGTPLSIFTCRTRFPQCFLVPFIKYWVTNLTRNWQGQDAITESHKLGLIIAFPMAPHHHQQSGLKWLTKNNR